MNDGKKTEKRSVHFGQEGYDQVIKAIRGLEGSLIRACLNTKEGHLHLEVEKGTSLEEFDHIKEGEKMSHDRRLKVRIKPLTPNDGWVLRKVFELTLGQFAKEVIQAEFSRNTLLTIVFGSHKGKESFIKILRTEKVPKSKPSVPYLASVTIHG